MMRKHLMTGALALFLSSSAVAQTAPVAMPGTASIDDRTTTVVVGPPSAPTFWANADYLLWLSKNAPRPGPLAVTGSINDLFPGALDQPGTRVLNGNAGYDYGRSNGMRLRLGAWLDDCQTVGVELGGTLLEQVATGSGFAGDANGQPFIGRPFTNVLTGNPNVYFVSQNFANPALTANMTGSLALLTQAQYWSWEANGLFTLARSEDSAWLGVLGFKSAALDERLVMDESIRNLVPGGGSIFNGIPTAPTQTVKIVDDFRASNRFYGGQLGTRYAGTMGAIVFDVSASCALGVTRQEMVILGATALYTGNQQVGVLPGGVLALPSNAGKHSRDVFGVIPEVGGNVGYRLTDWLTARVGYNFMYWNNVARPTQRVDTTVNPNRVPSDGAFGTPGGGNRPSFVWSNSDYWLHGVNFGLDFRW